MMDKLTKISNPYHFKLIGFPTSIWDESLYKAWSQIVCSLIPNINLFNINSILDAEEIILFEKTTFLVISSTASIKQQQEQQQHKLTNGKLGSQKEEIEELDPKRFEKISNIIKTYKQSISKLRTNFNN
ncbi:unnamed protein product [Candida parapsilosis]